MADTFTAPGPGQWALDRSHYPGGTTPISQEIMTEAVPAGLGKVFAELGAPVSRLDCAFVHGFMYTRVRPLIRGDKAATKLPPLPVLKLVGRVHPEFRRRAKQATKTLTELPSLGVAERWAGELKPQLVARNRAFQEFDVAGADDADLQRHVGDLLDHVRSTFELHFWLHGHDMGPIARFVHECERWGISGGDAVQALNGASPATLAPIRMLAEIRTLAGDAPLHTLDDVRAASPKAARMLDEYLAMRGDVLATGYDLTSLTLRELPGVVVGSIRSARIVDEAADHAHTQTVTAGLRARVPAADRDRFDELLGHARAVMDMRDDNGPQTVEWPLGLLRRALLEVGQRLTARGALELPEHALELTVAEARRALTGALPSASEIAARSTGRLASAELDPPVMLGDVEPEPPVDVLPGPLAAIVGMVKTSLKHMGMDGAERPDRLVGVGVGSTPYVGRACRAGNADEAIERLEPGDVLVVRATSPAFNAVLALAGAVVTADGGAMSHAAVLARELGIAAVIGAAGALDIPDGAEIEVDPVAGRVTVR